MEVSVKQRRRGSFAAVYRVSTVTALSPCEDRAVALSGEDAGGIEHAGTDFTDMVHGVSELQLHRRQPLEVVAADVFLGHADAAMQLDRLLAQEARALAQLHLGLRH